MSYIVSKRPSKTSHICAFCHKTILPKSYYYRYEQEGNVYDYICFCLDCNQYTDLHNREYNDFKSREECENALAPFGVESEADKALRYAGFQKLEDTHRLLFYVRREKTKDATFKSYIFINKYTKMITLCRFECFPQTDCAKDVVPIVFDPKSAQALSQKMSELT